MKLLILKYIPVLVAFKLGILAKAFRLIERSSRYLVYQGGGRCTSLRVFCDSAVNLGRKTFTAETQRAQRTRRVLFPTDWTFTD